MTTLATLAVIASLLPLAPAAVAAGNPDAPVVVAPTDGATNVTRPVALDVTATDPDSAELDVTFFGRQAADATAGQDFTLMTIPDTQFYSEQASLSPIFAAQTQWIVDTQAGLNTVFTTHLGDITQNFDAIEIEWQRATAHMATLDDAGLKNNVTTGNHDMNGSNANYYDEYFPPSRYEGFPWYGGYLGDPSDGIADGVNRLNKDNYELFSAGGMDFLIIHLEFDMPAYSVTWAQDVINAFPNRLVILSTHAFVNAASVRPSSPVGRVDGMSAQAVWTQLVAPNCNIFMVVNGHYHGEGRRTDNNDCGQPVFQLNSDYQSRINGGDGWLRYYTFKPSEDKIEAFTFSPTTVPGGAFENDANSRFTLDWPMADPGPFTQIGTANDVASGAHATIQWNGLDPGTEYEWYATVSDGSLSTTGPTSSFTTEVPTAAPPVVDSVTINQASPRTNDTLTVNVQSHDINNDPITFEYRWIKNGSDIPGGTSSTLNLAIAGNGDKGDLIRVRITASDGAATSPPVTSASVTVVNAAPTAAVVLSDHSPGTNASITATVTASDADTTDTVTLTYLWTVNGSTVRTTVTTALTDALDLSVAGNGDPGDSITVTVSPNDGTVNGSGVSESATVVSGPVPPIFSDEFANLSNWTATRITLDNTSGSPTSPSARAAVTAQSASAFRVLGTTTMTPCMSVNVNRASGAADLFRLRTAANGAIIKAVVTATGTLQLRADFGGTIINSNVALGTGWHNVELCGTVGTATTWNLYRDGVRIVTDWIANTGTTPVGRIQIGDTAAKTFTVNFDHVRLDLVPGEAAAPPDTQGPTTPGQPAGSSPSAGMIQIGWAASADDSPPITYRVYRDGNEVGQTTANTFIDPGLTPGESHTYTVDAVDSLNNPSLMGPVSASILVSGGATPPIFSDEFANLSNWTATRITLDNTSGSPTSPSARAAVTAQSASAFRVLGTTTMTPCMSVNVNRASGAADLFRLRTAANGAIIKAVVTATGTLQLRADFGGTIINSNVALGTGWHNVELCGTVGTATTWNLYRDGVRIVTDWIANTGTTPVGRIQIGDTAAKTFTVNFDHVVLDEVVG